MGRTHFEVGLGRLGVRLGIVKIMRASLQYRPAKGAEKRSSPIIAALMANMYRGPKEKHFSHREIRPFAK